MSDATNPAADRPEAQPELTDDSLEAVSGGVAPLPYIPIIKLPICPIVTDPIITTPITDTIAPGSMG